MLELRDLLVAADHAAPPGQLPPDGQRRSGPGRHRADRARHSPTARCSSAATGSKGRGAGWPAAARQPARPSVLASTTCSTSSDGARRAVPARSDDHEARAPAPPVPPRLLVAGAGLTALAVPPRPDALVRAGQRRARRASARRSPVNFCQCRDRRGRAAMAAIVKRQIVVDPRVRGQMTLYSEQPLTGARGLPELHVRCAAWASPWSRSPACSRWCLRGRGLLQTGTVSVGRWCARATRS